MFTMYVGEDKNNSFYLPPTNTLKLFLQQIYTLLC